MRILTIHGGRFLKGRVRHLVENALKDVEILGNSLVFSEPIKAEYGLFKASSSVIIGPKAGNRWFGYHTSGWLFNTTRAFLPVRKVESLELPITPAEYRIELEVPGSGMIELPGYRLENGVVFLYITPSYNFNFPVKSITIGDPENYAQLSLTPFKTGFNGEISLSLRKTGSVGVSVRGKVAEDMIFLGNEPGEFSYGFIDEPVLIVSHEKIISPQDLQNALGVTSTLSGHGNFTLHLSMGRKKKDMEFSVELPRDQDIM